MQDDALLGQLVLVVEDEPLFAHGLQQCLENAGAQVARPGLLEAPAFVQLATPSAAVLDCHPASRERRALIRLLRQCDVPFLFCSAQPPAHGTTERGAAYIIRPCPPEMLIAAVRYLLR